MKTKLLFSILITLSLNAFSQINSYNINYTFIGPGVLSFDIDNDGNNDFAFDIITLSPNVFAARVLTLGSSTMLDSTFGYPDTLNYGSPVSGYFHSGTGALGTINNAGQFNGSGDKYLGVKISSSGIDYLGWIKLNCSVNRDTLMIISCGYNMVAAAPINAGQTSLTALIENEQMLRNEISLFPNPFSSQATLLTNNPLKGATLTINNCFGQTVKHIKNISGQSVILLRENLTNGLYFIKLIQDNKVVATDKLVITN